MTVPYFQDLLRVYICKEILNDLSMTLKSSKLAILTLALLPPLSPTRGEVLHHPGAKVDALLPVLHHQRLQLHVLQSLHLSFFVSSFILPLQR